MTGGPGITKNERDVLIALSHGDTYDSIARSRRRHVQTVKAQANEAMRKLKARNAVEAVFLALSRGLIPREGDHPDCDSNGAYYRHVRRNEIPCPSSRAAHAARKKMNDELRKKRNEDG